MNVGSFTAANRYEELTKRKVLAHLLAEALIGIRDFDLAADLRDELDEAVQQEQKRREDKKTNKGA